MIYYRITQPSHDGIDTILDMVRYARAQLLKVEAYEKAESKQYIFRYLAGKPFFFSHVKPRWESFGCKVDVLSQTDELKTLVDDFEFHHGDWWNYDAEQFKKIFEYEFRLYKTPKENQG